MKSIQVPMYIVQAVCNVNVAFLGIKLLYVIRLMHILFTLAVYKYKVHWATTFRHLTLEIYWANTLRHDVVALNRGHNVGPYLVPQLFSA